MMSEYPDDFDESQLQKDNTPSQSKGPSNILIESKLFKTRQQGFEQLEQEILSDTAQYDLFVDWGKYVSDNQLGPQEKSLYALKAYLQKAPQPLVDAIDAEALVRALISKCLSQGKPQIKKVIGELLPDLIRKTKP